jgi:hypothetical protein
VRGLVCLLAIGLVACNSSPALRRSAQLSPAARAFPQRYLVVIVRNPVNMPNARAASTNRGYDSASSYIAGGVARSVSRALAQDYHLVRQTWDLPPDLFHSSADGRDDDRGVAPTKCAGHVILVC